MDAIKNIYHSEITVHTKTTSGLQTNDDDITERIWGNFPYYHS